MRVFQEEIFGPVVSVTRFDGEEEALRIANDTLYGLGAGVWSRDMGTAYSVAFLQLRENATGKTTTETQDAAVVRTVSKIIPGIMGAKWKTLTPAHKEKLYETTIMAAMIQGAIIEQLVATGDQTRVAAQRKDAADAFKQLIGVPPEQVEISPEGQISGTVPVEGAVEEGATTEDVPE